jgi:hypothetical protein
MSDFPQYVVCEVDQYGSPVPQVLSEFIAHRCIDKAVAVEQANNFSRFHHGKKFAAFKLEPVE